MAKVTAPQWSEAIAVFGGTFDPPHLGHCAIVENLLSYLGPKKVLILPSSVPPMKSESTPSQHRLAMTQILFQAFKERSPEWSDRLEVSDLEFARTARDARPSYSFDTLAELNQQHSNLCFVLGTDQFVSLHKWHRFPELLSLCHWVVFPRRHSLDDDAPYESFLKTIELWKASNRITGPYPSDKGPHWVCSPTLSTDSIKSIYFLDVELPLWSSTGIRQQIALTGKVPEGSTDPKVIDYLKVSHLYGT